MHMQTDSDRVDEIYDLKKDWLFLLCVCVCVLYVSLVSGVHHKLGGVCVSI